MCASTLCPLDSSTRNIAFGRASTMVPSSSMTPSFLGMSSHFCRRQLNGWYCRPAPLTECHPPDDAQNALIEQPRAARAEATMGQGKSVRHLPAGNPIGAQYYGLAADW